MTFYHGRLWICILDPFFFPYFFQKIILEILVNMYGLYPYDYVNTVHWWTNYYYLERNMIPLPFLYSLDFFLALIMTFSPKYLRLLGADHWFQILQQNCKAPLNIIFHIIKCIRSRTISFKCFLYEPSPGSLCLPALWGCFGLLWNWEFFMIPLYLHLHLISYTSLGFSGFCGFWGFFVCLF